MADHAPDLETIREKMSELFDLDLFVRPDDGYFALDFDEYYCCCEADKVEVLEEGDLPATRFCRRPSVKRVR